ncbi:MAG: WalW protein [Magnetococcales bacterium]|nr:WalW protein [Magnetococcales bacterium]
MSLQPILMVVVDTEEEFDWSAPLSPEATAVTAMAHVQFGQEICDHFAIRPVYVIDYPVASQEQGWLPLKGFMQEDRAFVGAHLHPWVNPPFVDLCEPVHSFPGNLPRHLEQEKLAVLTKQIASVMGRMPTIYKAGRYGLGPNTPLVLAELGYEFDLSSAPPYDFSDQGGPDFSNACNQPGPMSAHNHVLSLPTTGDYIGLLTHSRPLAHRIYRRVVTHPQLKSLHLPGIFARTRLLDRIRLSPEGHTLDELKRLTLALMHRGLQVFSFSFHSPSLKPGCTPYVRDKKDLQLFLATMHRYFHFFLHELNGIAMTPWEVKKWVEASVNQTSLTPSCR